MRLDDHYELNQEWLYTRPPAFVDADGDHAREAVLVIPGSFAPPARPSKLVAVSLRTGKQVWPKAAEIAGTEVLYRFVGDLDGDNLPEVIVVAENQAGDDVVALVEAFRGVDGTPLWTWNSGPEIRRNRPSPLAVMADLDGDGTSHVCVAFREPEGKWRVVMLGANGREATRREIPDENGRRLYAGDLDGAGRDELFLGSVDRLTALDRDLKERWSWLGNGSVGIKIMPRGVGQAATVFVSPAIGLDGGTGRPRWAALRRAEDSWETQQATFLDAGSASRLPLVLHHGHDGTICRAVQSLNPEGRPAPLKGACVPPGLARHAPALDATLALGAVDRRCAPEHFPWARSPDLRWSTCSYLCGFFVSPAAGEWGAYGRSCAAWPTPRGMILIPTDPLPSHDHRSLRSRSKAVSRSTEPRKSSSPPAPSRSPASTCDRFRPGSRAASPRGHWHQA